MIRRMKMISLFHDSDAGNGRVGVPELVWRSAAALFGRRRDADQNLAARALELALDARSLCRIAGHVRGLRIDCGQGRLWLTQAGASADVILQPGQGFTADREGPIVVQPLFETGAQDQDTGRRGRTMARARLIAANFNPPPGRSPRPSDGSGVRTSENEIALGTITVTAGPARLSIHRRRNADAAARIGVSPSARDGAERWEQLVFLALWLCGTVSVGYCLETLLLLP